MTDNVSDMMPELLRDIQTRLGALESTIEERLDKMHDGQVELLETIKEVAKGVNNLYELTRLHGSRLNVVDSRLAGIETELGLVKA